MELELLTYDFTVCRLYDSSSVDLTKKYLFVSVTDEEISLVCPTENAPDSCEAREDGWRCFRVCGVLDFSLIGILSRISGVLAQANIGIFVVSTYNTDYILVKKENLQRAVHALESDGLTVLGR